MGGKLNLYNLGDLGVHLVESPVHAPDGSFTNAQNAAVSQTQGEHGIRKRPGLAKLTQEAMSGSVLALGNMPFPDPFPPLAITGTRLYVETATDGSSLEHQTTTNGTTWTTAGTPPARFPDLAFESRFAHGGAISTNGALTYYKASGGAGLAQWNGTTETQIVSGFTLSGFTPRSIADYYGTSYLVLADATSGKLVKRAGSTFEQVTASIGKPATCLGVALNRVYIGTDENRIYYVDQDGTLTLDITISATGGNVSVTDIAHFEGVLYASAMTKPSGTTATTHKVLKRTADATWSDITPSAQGDYGPLAAFNGDLYCGRSRHNTFTGCEIHKYTGSAWSTDLDVTTLLTGADTVRALLVFNAALYAIVREDSTGAASVLRRTTGGAWSSVVAEIGASQTVPVGAIGFY